MNPDEHDDHGPLMDEHDATQADLMTGPADEEDE